MGKMYKRKTGLIILSGPVSKITPSAHGTEVSITIDTFEDKAWVTKDVIAVTPTLSPDLAVGCIATAYGYQCGKDRIMAESVTTGPSAKFVDDIEIISGPLNKAVYRNELNDDGTPKLKMDGTPRKPHFDVSVIVNDEQNHKVVHIVKIYNFKEAKNGKTEIEKAQAKFQNFVDRDTTPMEITIVTSPGQENSWESEWNGKIYQNYSNSHLGKFSWDVNQVGASVQQPVRNAAQPVQAATYAGGRVATVEIEDDEVFS